MKYFLILLSCVCLAITGCQSASLLPSRWSSNLFGPKDGRQVADDTGSTRKDPKSPSSRLIASDDYRKGEEALQRGDLSDARKHFKKVVQNEPQNVDAHHRLAYIADKFEEYTTAEIHYLAAMRLEPQNVDIACDLGYSYLLQGRKKDARRNFQKALRIDPQHKSSLLNLATLEAQEGKYDEALAFFRQAGSEEEAQQNIARFFPEGPPTGQSGTQVASREMPNAATRELQEKIDRARMYERQREANQNREGGRPFPVADTPHDSGQPSRNQSSQGRQQSLANLQRREVPPDQINELFAQIDAEYDQQHRRSQEKAASPQETPPADLISENPPPAADDPLQTRQVAEAPEEKRAESPPWPSDSPEGSSVPMDFGDYAVVNMEETSEEDSSSRSGESNSGETAVSESPAFPDKKLPVIPSAHEVEPPELTRSSPAEKPASEPTGSSSKPVDSDQYREMVTLAMQLGMNTGPGQLFPLSVESSGQPMDSVNNDERNSIAKTLSPRHAKMDEQTTPEAASSPATHHESPQASSSIQQVNGIEPESSRKRSEQPQKESRTNTIPDWPYSPEAQKENRPAENDESGDLPWLQQSTDSRNRGEAEPTIQPAGSDDQDSRVTPQQWPHSPQN